MFERCVLRLRQCLHFARKRRVLPLRSAAGSGRLVARGSSEAETENPVTLAGDRLVSKMLFGLRPSAGHAHQRDRDIANRRGDRRLLARAKGLPDGPYGGFAV
jgi:hypothetical protein